MNIEAMTAAEKFAQTVLKLPIEKQNEYFAMLPSFGLTAEEVQSLQKYVSLYHMFTDETFYKKVRETVGLMLWKDFNS